MSDMMPGQPGDTNPAPLAFASNVEYGDAIGEIAMLAQSCEDPKRLVALIGAALKYIAADSRTTALNEALDAVRAEYLTDDTGTSDDKAYNQAVSDGAASIAKLLGGA